MYDDDLELMNVDLARMGFEFDFPLEWKAEASYPSSMDAEDPAIDLSCKFRPGTPVDTSRYTGVMLLPDPSLNPRLLSCFVSAKACPLTPPAEFADRFRAKIEQDGGVFDGWREGVAIDEEPAFEVLWHDGERSSTLRVLWLNGIRYTFQCSGSPDNRERIAHHWEALLASVEFSPPWESAHDE